MSVQLATVEGKQRKKFTANQRLEILREWDATGNGVEVSRHHGIHPLTLYRWKKRLEQGAAEFLKGTRSKPNPEVKELQRENQKLKDTVTLSSEVYIDRYPGTKNRVNFSIRVYSPEIVSVRIIPMKLSPIHTCVFKPAAGLPISHPGC